MSRVIQLTDSEPTTFTAYCDGCGAPCVMHESDDEAMCKDCRGLVTT